MKKIKCKYISMIMIILMSALFFSPVSNVYALDTHYDFVSLHSEPTTSDYSGYMNVALQSPRGIILNTYAWYIVPSYVDGDYVPELLDVYVDANVYSNYIDFMFNNNSFGSYYVYLYELCSDGQIGFLVDSYESGSFVTKRVWTSGDVLGFSFYGNIKGVSFSEGYYVPSVSVTWNNERLSLDSLTKILLQLELLNENTDELILEIVNIYNKCDSIGKAVNSIYAQVITYFSRYNDSLDHIEELLETIESCVMEQSDIDRDSLLKGEYQIQQGTQIMDEERGELTEEIPLDENGVPLDDMEENGNKIKNLIDQISGFNITNYTVILNIFTEHEQITYMFVIALTFALVSFALFGRK